MLRNKPASATSHARWPRLHRPRRQNALKRTRVLNICLVYRPGESSNQAGPHPLLPSASHQDAAPSIKLITPLRPITAYYGLLRPITAKNYEHCHSDRTRRRQPRAPASWTAAVLCRFRPDAPPGRFSPCNLSTPIHLQNRPQHDLPSRSWSLHPRSSAA